MLKKEDEVEIQANPLEVNYLQGTQWEGGENKHTGEKSNNL